jgi:hypothetical protein
MTTEKQIAANRRNALKGGVKTEKGNAAVRLNAVSHGIFCQDVLLPGENHCLFKALHEKFMAEIQPEGEMENLLVERLVTSVWRLKRALRYEQSSTQKGCDYRFGEWDKFLRYETAMERQIFKTLSKIMELQKSRLIWENALQEPENDSAASAQSSAVGKALVRLQEFYDRHPALRSPDLK